MPENKKSSLFVRVKNFVEKMPGLLPSEQNPKEKSNSFSNIKTIPWYTTTNDFARQLVTMLEICNTHHACVYTKADYCTRDSFGITKGRSSSVIKTRTIASEQAVEDVVIQGASEWAEKVNIDNQTLKDIVNEAIINYEALGNTFIELVRGGEGSDKFFSVYNHHAGNCLFAINDDNSVTHIYISSDWDDDSIKSTPPAKLPFYPEWEEINGAERCIIHIKGYSIGRDYYGLPGFISAFKDNLVEYEITHHNLEEFFTGFMPKVYMMFLGADGWTQTEKDRLIDDVQNTYTKKNRKDPSEKLMVQVEESVDLKPFIHEFSNTQKEGDYKDLRSNSINSIHKAHRWHPVLASEAVAAGFDDGKKFKTIFEIYNEATIKPIQNKMMNGFVNIAFREAADWLNGAWKGHSLTLSTSCPVSFLGDIDINAIISVDEAREHVGLDKRNDDTGTKFVKEVGSNKQKEVAL